MADLISTIEDKLLEKGGIIQQLTEKLFPCLATIKEFDKEKQIATVQFLHPLYGQIMVVPEVPIRLQRGIVGGYLEEGDRVLITFPSDSASNPVIVASYNTHPQTIYGGGMTSKMLSI
jgi:hypothetical protein